MATRIPGDRQAQQDTGHTRNGPQRRTSSRRHYNQPLKNGCAASEHTILIDRRRNALQSGGTPQFGGSDATMDDEGLPWQFIIASCLEKQLHAYASLLGPAQAVARGLKHRAVSTAGADFLVSARVTGSVQAYLNLLRASPQPAASMLSYALAFYSSLPSEGVTLPDSLLPRLQTAVSAMDPAMVEEATQQARCVLAKIRADYSGDSGRDEDASEEDSGDALSERMCTGVTSRGAHGHGMGASPASCPFLNPPNQQDWSTRLIRIAIALCVAAGLAVVIIETYRDLSSGGRWRAEL